MEDEPGNRRNAELRICLRAVVEQLKLGKAGEKVDQVVTASVISLPNFCLGDVMPPRLYARPDPCDVEFRAFQSNVPQPDCRAGAVRAAEQGGNGVASQRGFEGEIQARRDGILEQPLT